MGSTKYQKWAVSLAICLAIGAVSDGRADGLRFDVASVKSAAAGPHFGLRFKESPGRIHYSAVSLRELIVRAYRRKDYQVDAPGWMASEYYDVEATFSPEAESRVPEMLRTLLTERLNLRVRSVDKPVKGLALRVRPNQTTTLRPASEPGKGGIAFLGDKLAANLSTMGSFCDLLSSLLILPVFDETGLTDRYTFELKLPPEISATGQPVFGDASAVIASLKEIGLVLVSRTVTDNYIIADGAERIPTDN